MAIAAFLISGFLASLWAIFADYLHAVPTIPGERERMRKLIGSLAPRSRYAKILANDNGNGAANGVSNGGIHRDEIPAHELQSHQHPS